MTLPRQILPGRFYLLTRRCTQRQFLLRPDKDTNNAFIYCLAEAAQRCEIEVVLPVAMSNHYHAVVFDRTGTLPAFMERFHKMLAKCQNALRGRWENFWSSEQACIVHCVDPEDVIRKLVYVATNPVKDDLVERVDQWPGVNGLHALLKQEPMSATRPRHFFRPDGSMPETVTLKLVVPPELGTSTEVLAALRADVLAAETDAKADRAKRRVRVLGRSRVKEQDWRDNPTTREPRRNLRPVLAARSEWSRKEAILRNRAFLAAYREARDQWVLTGTATFPPGTYWLRRFANVPVEA